MKLYLALVVSVFLAQGQAASWWFSSSDDDSLDEDAIIEPAEVLSQGQTASWWFSSSDDDHLDEDAIIEPVEEITQECLNLCSWGQCAFYDCLERRFPCGSEGYTEKVSKHFCSKVDRNFDQFDTFGRRWLNQTSICLHSYMLPIYQGESTTCGDIKRAGIEAIVSCNEGTVDNHNFCHFLDTNGEAYKGLMGSHEISLLISLRDSRVFRSMVSDTVSCGVENLREFASRATSRFMDLMGSLWSSIW